jgi:protein TonB
VTPEHLNEAGEATTSSLAVPRREPFPPKPAGLLQPVLAVPGEEIDAATPAADTLPPETGSPPNARARRIGLTLSLTLHLSILAALIGYVALEGMTETQTEAISVELVPTKVLESLEQTESRDAAAQSAASASASTSEENSTAEEPPEPKQQIEPEKTEPEPVDETLPESSPPTEQAAAPKEQAPEAGEPPPQETGEVVQQSPVGAEAEKAEQAPSARQNAPAKPVETRPSVVARPEPEKPRTSVRMNRIPAEQRGRRAEQTADAQSAAAKGSSGSAASARQSASRGSALNYAALVRARVAANKPAGGSARGRVTVSFGVSSSGGVTFIRVSGLPALSGAATSAVRRASPFPPPPPGAPRTFSISFYFE